VALLEVTHGLRGRGTEITVDFDLVAVLLDEEALEIPRGPRRGPCAQANFLAGQRGALLLRSHPRQGDGMTTVRLRLSRWMRARQVWDLTGAA